MAESLERAYPEARMANGYWQDINNTRKFFSDFAESKNFDPKEARAWHAIPLHNLTSIKVMLDFLLSILSYNPKLLILKGGLTILKKYGTFPKALKQAFPEVTEEFKRMHTSLLLGYSLIILSHHPQSVYCRSQT